MYIKYEGRRIYLKRKLLDTAIELFCEHGYENVSIQMICKNCNVTKGSFYHHYSSKSSLLAEYYSIKTKDDLTEILIDMLSISDPLDKVWKIVGYYPECNNTLNPDLNINLIKVNMDQGGKLYPVLIENVINYYPSVAKVLQKVTEEGQAEGAINSNYNWGELFELYCAAFHGLLVEWGATNGEFDLMKKIYQYYLMIYKSNN